MKDKEKIKEEIERRISQFEAKYPKDLGGFWNDEESAAYDCAEEYKRFLLFIDSLPEEPASEDLEEAAVSVIKKLGGMEPDDNVSYHEVKIFKAGAEWQKKKLMQDFLEKVEEFLYLQLNNGSIECGNIERLIDDFKNYIQNESEN